LLEEANKALEKAQRDRQEEQQRYQESPQRLQVTFADDFVIAGRRDRSDAPLNRVSL